MIEVDAETLRWLIGGVASVLLVMGSGLVLLIRVVARQHTEQIEELRERVTALEAERRQYATADDIRELRSAIGALGDRIENRMQASESRGMDLFREAIRAGCPALTGDPVKGGGCA